MPDINKPPKNVQIDTPPAQSELATLIKEEKEAHEVMNSFFDEHADADGKIPEEKKEAWGKVAIAYSNAERALKAAKDANVQAWSDSLKEETPPYVGDRTMEGDRIKAAREAHIPDVDDHTIASSSSDAEAVLEGEIAEMDRVAKGGVEPAMIQVETDPAKMRPPEPEAIPAPRARRARPTPPPVSGEPLVQVETRKSEQLPQETEEQWHARMQKEAVVPAEAETVVPEERAWLSEVGTFGTDAREKPAAAKLGPVDPETDRRQRQTAALLQAKVRQENIANATDVEDAKIVGEMGSNGKREPTMGAGIDPYAERQTKSAYEDESKFGPSGEKTEATPGEWKEKLRSLIAKAPEKIAPGAEVTSEGFKKAKGYLDRRAKEMDAKASEMGGVEKWFRGLGERYNKLSRIHQLGIGIALGTGAAVSAAAFAPAAALLFGAGLGIQRFYGMSSMFLKIEKDLQTKKVGENSTQFVGRKERAMLDAMLYTAVMGTAIAKGLELAGEYEVVDRAREWFGNMLGHHSVPAPAAETASGAAAVSTASGDALPASGTPLQSASVESNAPIKGMPPVAPTAAAPIDAAPQTANSQIPSGEPVALDTAPKVDTVPSNVDAPADSTGAAETQSLSTPTEAAGVTEQPPVDGNRSERIFSSSDFTPNDLQDQDMAAMAQAAEVPSVPSETPAVEASGAAASVPQSEAAAAPAETPAAPEGPASSTESAPPAAPETPPASAPSESSTSVADTPAPEAPAQAPEAQAPSADAAPATEASPTPSEAPQSQSAAPEASPSMERTSEFVNRQNLSINPLEGHVFQDTGGAVLAYGNDYASRLEAAQSFVIKNHEATVWVQAAEPYVGPDGVARPYVIPVKYSSGLLGFGGGPQVLIPNGIPDPEQIGGINPDTFIKQLDT